MLVWFLSDKRFFIDLCGICNSPCVRDTGVSDLGDGTDFGVRLGIGAWLWYLSGLPWWLSW